jgi:IS5 family transposase
VLVPAAGTTTAANTGDVTEVAKFLHGKGKAVYGDSGYRGAEKRVKATPGRRFYIAEQRSKVKAIQDATLRELTEQIVHFKASIRSAVEHPFRVVKRQFGYSKASYRGLTKNHGQVVTLFAMAKLWMARKRLLAAG